MAEVSLGAESYDEDVRFSGQQATFMGVWVMPTESTLEVIKRVRDALPAIESGLPSDLKMNVGYDATAYIDDALKEIVKTLGETLMIVAVVIFLFLGSVRSVLIPLVAMPLSLIGAMFVMLVLGFTINLLTLLAIVLAVGIVVDDAIVIVENVERHVREGKSPFDAAVLGARELVGPVISMTITLAAVYAPIGFQGGLTGALFREFAFTLAGAVTVSGFVALTLSPMMSARLLKDHEHEDRGLSGFTNRLFDRLRVAYDRVIGGMLAIRERRNLSWGVLLAGLVVTAVLFIGGYLAMKAGGMAMNGRYAGFLAMGSLLFGLLPAFLVTGFDVAFGRRFKKVQFVMAAGVMLCLLLPVFFMFAQHELAPKEDQGFIGTFLIASPTSTMEHNTPYAEEVQKLFESVPEYEASFQLTTPSFGFGGLIAKPWSERKRTTVQIEQSLHAATAKITGMNVVLNTPDALPSGGQYPIEFVIRSTADHKQMLDIANQLTIFANTEANAPDQAPTFYFADSDLKFDLPQYEIEIDKDKVAAMGLSLTDIAHDLGSMLGGGYVNRFVNDGRSYRVIPQVERAYRLTADQILDYHVRGPKGQLVPLSTIASLKETVQPRTLNRFQQLNSIKIIGVGPSPDQALKKLEKKAAEILPPEYSIDYGGQSRQLRYEGNALVLSGALALVLIFLVLAAQFNSFRDPFIILLGSVPLALVGAALPIFLWKTSLNIYSQIGMITLVGLVAKNGILIVEFANGLQEQGVAKLDAARRAAATRLRPVLMTSAATVFGHLMLIFVTGPGAAARNSIGWVLVIGMTVGSFFTLFIVPAFYALIARDHSKDRHIERESTLLAPQIPELAIK